MNSWIACLPGQLGNLIAPSPFQVKTIEKPRLLIRDCRLIATDIFKFPGNIGTRRDSSATDTRLSSSHGKHRMFIYGPLARSPLFRSDSRDEATFQNTNIDVKSSLSCKNITTPLRCASRGHDYLPAYMMHPNCSHKTRHAQCQPFRLITTKCDPILQICRELNHQSVAWIGEYVLNKY